MPNQNNATSQKIDASTLPVSFGAIAGVLFFLIVTALSYWNTHMLSRNSQQVAHTHEVISSLDILLSLVKDAETGQRGYLLVGDDKYLTPYSAALTRIDESIAKVEQLIQDDAEQEKRFPVVTAHIHNKLAELAETIELRRSKGFDTARAVVVTDRGKGEMDAIRSIIGTMQQQEREIRTRRLAEMDEAYKISFASGFASGIIGILLTLAVAYLTRQADRARRRQEWLQTGEVNLGALMSGEPRIEKLGEHILRFLAEYLGAHSGAFFTNQGGSYQRAASYGISPDSKLIEQFASGETLLGQAVKDKKTYIIRDVPDGYLTVGSGLGSSNPRNLIISPAMADDHVNSVLELAFIHPLNEATTELLERVSESIAVAVRSANDRAHIQNILEETQRQAEELQAQSEELRVNNEELEEQGRALKESQTRLEQQQAELEQTNSQLEEQAQILEHQKNDISLAKAAVQLKAQELEQASQYKSDFLANMSHELRTPLNSSLILAKLLADNSAGNLTAEQVKFAQTIQSSGNDLLALINDILDLSKIEAGHMEVHPESISIERLTMDLQRVFEPLAGQKKLAFETKILPDCPKMVDTDRQRLEQILKNLISNAIKFTEEGKVTLSIGAAANGEVVFSVTDTGIGIAEQQQQAIFDAFRQADGTISRKYGGTGLGLSISRELTRLLSGRIQLKSTLGQGSTFSVTLPAEYQPQAATQPRSTVYIEPAAPWPAPLEIPTSPVIKRISRVPDDREKLTRNKHLLLVVEDDESFARILYDLTHELDFQCLIANSAEEALAMAMQFLPSAVILDVGLPDHSGLTVLDRLKRDARTRHIPIHVVSGGDHAKTALSLGAIGYMLKPVKREQLIDTLKGLETRLDQRMRHVLIVEDDDTQRDSMQKLLGSHDVQTTGAGTAKECLELLKEKTFDCMVLDLSLPDASGYSLLETLSNQDTYSFPPVIVYTGRDLSSDEEQRLRRYSKSIIIKGAKSPERLLDEVTLFLHQVVADLPPEQQKMLEIARNRDSILEGRRILVVEDDIRNVYAVTSIFEPLGALVQIARNGREALAVLEKNNFGGENGIDLVLMDVMMPEMDGLTATREIRKRSEWKKLPIIMLTAKAMKDDQERCLDAGANDYMAKPLDVDKLMSLVRVWMPR